MRITVLCVIACLTSGASATELKDKVGVFAGFAKPAGVQRFLEFEQWLGRELKFVCLNIGRKSVKDMTGSAWGQFERKHAIQTLSRRVQPTITIPLNIGNADAETPEGIEQIKFGLTAVANGLYDKAYAKVAKRLVTAGFESAILRLGHEPDHKLYPHSVVGGNHEQYKAAFRHVHDIFERQAGAEFLFDYNLNAHITKHAELAYPGDEYVDIVGLDFYDKAPWATILKRLEFHRGFAIEKGKLLSFPEFGLALESSGGNGDNPVFLQNVYDWITSLPENGPGSLVYVNYFNNPKRFNLDNFPQSKKLFKELFGEKDM